jgi:hypothetical protein
MLQKQVIASVAEEPKKSRPHSAPTYLKPEYEAVLSPTKSTSTSQLQASNRFLMGTDGSHNRINAPYIRNHDADDGSPKDWTHFVPPRRPISAPHVSKRSGLKQSQSDSGLRALTNQSNRTAYLYEDDGQTGLNNSYLYKHLALSGSVCFGDYCHFIEHVREHLSRGEEGEAKQATQVGSLSQNSKSSSCPYRLAQKSVLLVRHEIKFTGLILDDKVHSWVLRIKLSQMDPNQLYAYFVRRHINTVAQKCQDEARKISMSASNTPMSMWDDLNLVYRRLVICILPACCFA